MRILFLHPNFPGQFLNIASYLGASKKHKVIFLTQRDEMELNGVEKISYKETLFSQQTKHLYIKPVEKAVVQGLSAYKAALKLKYNGFAPDIIVGHSGWGSTLFMKDLFPHAALIGYFEWYTNCRGGVLDFDPMMPLSLDTAFAARISNAPILTDLYSCDAGISPTYWQRSQFPSEYHSKISVIHDGIDTEYFIPDLKVDRIVPEIGLDLRKASEIVTYVGRGMEPYRGFPQFMEAVSVVQQRRPFCHVVIVGADRMAYGGPPAPDGMSYKEWMLKKLDLDLSRIHFTGLLPRCSYRKVLQMSTLHVYLTVPFVLSWSMLEAMSTECLLVASNTAPVKEVIVDGENGRLVDFFDTTAIAKQITETLEQRDDLAYLRKQARKTIVEKYELKHQISMQMKMLQQLCRC